MALPDNISTDVTRDAPSSASDAVLRGLNRQGPYVYNGNTYIVITHDTGSACVMEIVKNTDVGTNSWALQDSAGRPGTLGGAALEECFFDSTFDGTNIHIAQLYAVNSSNCEVHYHEFDCSTDQWTTTNEVVIADLGMNSPDNNWQSVAIHYRPNTANELVVLGNGSFHSDMGSFYGNLDAFHKDIAATSWTGPVSMDGSQTAPGTTHLHTSAVAQHQADVIHCYLSWYTTRELRDFTSTNTRGGTGYTSGNENYGSRASDCWEASLYDWQYVSSASSTNFRVRQQNVSSSTALLATGGSSWTLQIMTPAESTGFVSIDDVDATPKAYCGLHDGATLHIEHGTHGGTWTVVNTDFWGSDNSIDSSVGRVISRGGGRYLGVVGFDSTNQDWKYDEYEIQAAPSGGIGEYFYSGWDIKRLMDRMIKVPGR